MTDKDPTAAGWVLGYRSESRDMELWHLNGVAWHDAPLPPARHRCTAQTFGYTNHFRKVERCACGAITMDGQRPFLEKNSTRKANERKARAGKPRLSLRSMFTRRAAA